MMIQLRLTKHVNNQYICNCLNTKGTPSSPASSQVFSYFQASRTLTNSPIKHSRLVLDGEQCL